MEKINESELKTINDYFQKEAESTAKIGRISTEIFLQQERLKDLEQQAQSLKERYIQDNRLHFNFMQTLLAKYGATEINMTTGELIIAKEN